MTWKFKQLNLNGQGANKALGELEHKIMEILWSGGVMTSREIYQALAMKQKIALTTVTTIIGRLVDKSLLIKTEARRGSGYRAAYDKKQFLTLIAKDLLCSWLQDRELSAAHFNEALSELSSSEKKVLRRLLSDTND